MDPQLTMKFYIVICTIICASSCIMMIYLLSQLKRMKRSQETIKEVVKEDTESLQKKLDNLERMQVQLGQGLLNADEKLQDWVERINRLEIRDSHFGSYQHAAKLVELGANSEEVISTCGLSRAEAELVIMVNKKSKREPNNHNDDTKVNI